MQEHPTCQNTNSLSVWRLVENVTLHSQVGKDSDMQK